MKRTARMAVLSLGILGLGSAGLVAGGQKTSEGPPADEATTVAPATKHQGQVLEGAPEGSAATTPGAQAVEGKPETTEGMPATEHQQQVLKNKDAERQESR